MAGTDDRPTTTTDTHIPPVHQFDTMKDRLTNEPWYDPETGCELLRGWHDEETDRTCAVVKHVRIGYYTGYVRTTVPTDALDTIEDVGARDHIRVHGGVTYAKDGWIGFDTAHAYDRNLDDDDYAFGCLDTLPTKETQDWRPEDVYEETERLADGVAAFEQQHDLEHPGHPDEDDSIDTSDS